MRALLQVTGCLMSVICGTASGIVAVDGKDHQDPAAQQHRNMRHRNGGMLNHRAAAQAMAGPTSMVGGDAALHVMHRIAKRHEGVSNDPSRKAVPAAEKQDKTREGHERKIVDRLQRTVRRVLRAEQYVRDPKEVNDLLRELKDAHNMFAQGKAPPELMGAIDAMRAEMCAERGFESDQYDECLEFMKGACDPGKDHLMDGDPGEKTSQKGFCKKFFPEEAPAPAPAPKAEEEKAAPAPAPAVKKAAPAPAAEEKAAAPAPAPAPAPVEIVDTPKPGDWDNKKKEDAEYPEQGFEGPPVQHNDQKTVTSDWRKEFGPKHTSQTYRSICADHPDNEWCRRNGHYKKSGTAHRSGTMSLAGLLLVLVGSTLLI